MEGWLKILIPVFLGLICSLTVAAYNARKTAERQSKAHADQIKADREKTRQVRDKIEANHEQRLTQLEKARDHDSEKIDKLGETINQSRIENSGAFGKLFEAIEGLKRSKG